MTYVVPHLTEGLIEVCKTQSKEAIPILVSRGLILDKIFKREGTEVIPSEAEHE